jgi:KDO2-lipid IV(A) lauroyltransferase
MTLRQRLRYALETAAAYTVYGFFRLLPLDMASNTGGWIGRKIGPRLPPTATARQNLAMAFPEKSAEEREKIIIGMWDNLGRTVAEYAHLHHIWERVELQGKELLPAIRDRSRPAIFCGAHMANWEINAIAGKQNGVDISVVYRKPNNPGVDGLLRHARDAGAAAHIRKGREGAREMVAVLKKNGVLGILIDQKLNEGVPIPFFGRDAMTAPAIGHFALKFGCPIYPSRVERLDGCHFKMTLCPPLLVPHTGSSEQDVRAMLLDMNHLLESWIRERPEQWLWIHKRWPD